MRLHRMVFLLNWVGAQDAPSLPTARRGIPQVR
jgi:hypothetical protein